MRGFHDEDGFGIEPPTSMTTEAEKPRPTCSGAITRANAPAGEMTIREKLAAKAMQGLIASFADGPLAPDQSGDDRDEFAKMHGDDSVAAQIARYATVYADALLAALEKPQSTGGEDA